MSMVLRLSGREMFDMPDRRIVVCKVLSRRKCRTNQCWRLPAISALDCVTILLVGVGVVQVFLSHIMTLRTRRS
jgi:hypothetical protein